MPGFQYQRVIKYINGVPVTNIECITRSNNNINVTQCNDRSLSMSEFRKKPLSNKRKTMKKGELIQKFNKQIKTRRNKRKKEQKKERTKERRKEQKEEKK